MKQKDINQRVEQILKDIPETRDSDNLLVLNYINRCYPHCCGTTNYYKKSLTSDDRQCYIHEVIDWTLLMETGICFESISRSRRALKEKYPSSKMVEKMRKEKEKEMYNEYSTNKAYIDIFSEPLSDAEFEDEIMGL